MRNPVKRRAHQSELGQFMTPEGVAKFMASLFPPSTLETCRLLDAGAGEGALSCAFLDRWLKGELGFQRVEATAYEIDATLSSSLRENLSGYENTKVTVFTDDYITSVVGFGDLFSDKDKLDFFTHVILNPPYKKIASSSFHGKMLRASRLEYANLYSAFIALALRQTERGGHIVALVPRSFCNGPYYRKFRNCILTQTSIHQIHLFESRKKTFHKDNVLQENIIVHLEKGGAQGDVTISTSTDGEFEDLKSNLYSFNQIVLSDDSECFIRVPKENRGKSLFLPSFARHSLNDLGIKVSTGPVVDFRLREHIRDMPEMGATPLIYPCHLKSSGIEWPSLKMKKPNAIMRSSATERWLYPNGFYCVVRRFSAKEEKKRIIASVVDPSLFEGHEMLGFENHLNLFHENGRSLSEPLARGLALFLNSSIVDDYFRQFNGHTQVNAADLKFIKYPDRNTLIYLGDRVMEQEMLAQEKIDSIINSIAA